MNTSVAVAEIASKTAIWLALIGAAVKLAPSVLPRLQISNPRGQRATGTSGDGSLDGQKQETHQ